MDKQQANGFTFKYVIWNEDTAQFRAESGLTRDLEQARTFGTTGEAEAFGLGVHGRVLPLMVK